MQFLLPLIGVLASIAGPEPRPDERTSDPPPPKQYAVECAVVEHGPRGTRKLVAEPTLSTLDSRAASYLSGGWVWGAKAKDQKPEYLPFGTSLDFCPKRDERGRVHVELKLEISHVKENSKEADPRVVDLRLELSRVMSMGMPITVKWPRNDGRPGNYQCIFTVREVP